MAKSSSISPNTTISISFAVTIVSAGIAIGMLYSQVGSMQQQINNNSVANTTTALRHEAELNDIRAHYLPKDVAKETREHIEDILKRHDDELIRLRSHAGDLSTK